jgi:hypothetical protein
MVVFAVFVGAGVSMFALTRVLGFGTHGSFVGGLFYMMTPDVFGRLHEGHFSYLVSYGLAPLALALFALWTRSRSSKVLLSGALVYSVSWAQGQFAILLLVLFLLYSAFTSKSLRDFSSGMGALLFFNAIGVLMHNPWPLVFLLHDVPTGLVSAQLSQALNLQIINAIRLQGYTVIASPFNQETYAFGGPFLLALGFLPALLWSLGVALNPRSRVNLCFAIVGIISLFLATGTYLALGGTYLAFLGSPILALFRDPEHFLFLTALSYGVLISSAARALTDRVNRPIFFNMKTRWPTGLWPRVSLSSRSLVTVLFVTILVLSTSAPFLTGNAGGALQVYNLGSGHYGVYQFLASQQGYYHIAWLPLGSVGIYPKSTISPSRDPTTALSPKPAIDPDTVVWNPYFAFLSMTSAGNTTRYLAKLLGLANVKYVMTRNDFTPYGLQISNGTALLAGQEGLDQVTSFGDSKIFVNNDYLPPIYSSNDSVLIAGDRSSLVSLSYLREYQNRTLPLAFFASDLTTDTASLISMVNRIVIVDNDYMDLVTPFIPDTYKIDSGNFAQGSDPNYGWTYVGRAWSLGWQLTTPIEPVAVTEKSDSLKLPLSADSSGSYEVWIRTYDSPRASYLNFSIDGRNAANITTYSRFEGGYKWVEVATVNLGQGNHVLNVRSGRGENLIGRVIAVPTQTMNSAFQSMIVSLGGKEVISLAQPGHVVNDSPLVRDSRQWGSETSQGVSLESLSPVRANLNIWAPLTGEYNVRFRSNNSSFFQRPTDDLNNSSRWIVFGQGSTSIANSFGMQSNSSLEFSFSINKTNPGIHILSEHFSSPQDWSAYDTIGFWVYPKTTISPAYLVVSAQDSSGDWFTTQYYAAANQWSYVQLDMSQWNRSSIILLRLATVGDSWQPYVDGQQIDLFMDRLSLFRITNSSHFVWSSPVPFLFASGYNELPLEFDQSGKAFDLVSIEPASVQKTSASQSTTYREVGNRLSETQYEIAGNLSKSFVIQAVNYDSNWVAKDGAQTLPHFIAFGSFNAYWVSDQSTQDITISFALEPINDFGNLLAFATLFLLSALIVFPSRWFPRLTRIRTINPRLVRQR